MTQVSDSKKQGFILMPFDPAFDWLHETIEASGLRAGVELQRADNIFAPGNILKQIFDSIDQADVVIAVCTGKNANVFFELGYAWRNHNPVLVAEVIDDLPFDVKPYRTACYGRANMQGERERFGGDLQRYIEAALAEEKLPRGYRLSTSPKPKQVACLTARHNKDMKGSGRLMITNAGTIDLMGVTVKVPKEARSFHIDDDDLPLKILRVGTSITIPVTLIMDGGPGIFDIDLSGQSEDGKTHTFPVTISPYV